MVYSVRSDLIHVQVFRESNRVSIKSRKKASWMWKIESLRVPETRYPKPDTGDPRPETRDPIPALFACPGVLDIAGCVMDTLGCSLGTLARVLDTLAGITYVKSRKKTSRLWEIESPRAPKPRYPKPDTRDPRPGTQITRSET